MKLHKTTTIAVLLLLFLFSACSEPENRVVKVDAEEKLEKEKQNVQEIDKTPKKKTFEQMTAEEASSFFGFDFEPKMTYTGSYEYYLNEGKEVLHGEIKIQSKEARGDFIEKYKAEYGGEIEAAQHFLETKYSGSYKDGAKDGLFKQEADYYESTGVYTITFDAGQCTNATYKGTGEGYCFAYDGPLKECKFSEIEGLTKEVECE